MSDTTTDEITEPEVPDTVPDPEPKTTSVPAFDPTEEYGEFEGKLVVGVVTKINGTSSRISRPIHPGEKLYTLVVAQHSATAHKTTKEGWKRHQTLSTEEVYELTGELGAALEAACRAELKAAGRLDGQLRIDDETTPTIDVTVDANGVVLTEREKAEALGTPRYDEALGMTPPRAGEPFAGYDELKASDVVEHVHAIEYVDVAEAVIDYEKRGKKRGGIITAAYERLEQLQVSAADET